MEPEERATSGHGWPRTPWTLLRAARETEGAERGEALEELFRLYLEPVRGFYARVLRISGDELDEVTQELFLLLLERDFTASLRYEGSFRGFLRLACRRHHLRRLERSSHDPLVPFVLEGHEVPDPESVEAAFDEELRRHYLRLAHERTLERLADREVQREVFAARTRLDDAVPTDYVALAERFGLSVYSVRNHLTAARKVFRQELRRIAAKRSDDPSGELRELGLLGYL